MIPGFLIDDNAFVVPSFIGYKHVVFMMLNRSIDVLGCISPYLEEGYIAFSHTLVIGDVLALKKNGTIDNVIHHLIVKIVLIDIRT